MEAINQAHEDFCERRRIFIYTACFFLPNEALSDV